MATQEPYTLRWGFLSCGTIAKMFADDLVQDPIHRGATDVKHIISAASTRNSSPRAQSFLTSVSAPAGAKAYGSYAELVADKDVDIVYVSTPHSHHYQHARMALEANKHVLCEKAFTVNAGQTEILVKIARERGLFLMEAVWTRWFPLMKEISDIVTSGGVGDVVRVFADVSQNKLGGDIDDGHRLVDMNLAGGVMFDLGVYSITWAFQFLYHLVPGQGEPKVVSSVTKYEKTGVDAITSIIMTFPKGNTQGVATSSLRVASDPDSKGTALPVIRIQGTKGEIQVTGMGYRPESYQVIPHLGSDTVALKCTPYLGNHGERGMYFEADECARCLRDGKLESEGLPLEESIVIMKVMDEVRRQNGLVYPEHIESTEYPLAGF